MAVLCAPRFYFILISPSLNLTNVGEELQVSFQMAIYLIFNKISPLAESEEV